MPHTNKSLRQHPYANSHRGEFGECSMFSAKVNILPRLRSWMALKGIEADFMVQTADASRWLAHTGEKESMRATRRAEAALERELRLGGRP